MTKRSKQVIRWVLWSQVLTAVVAFAGGQWAGGPTASGVYPRADHTIAVDANDPTVPMGTEIIMNGELYKVEDTGNFDRYGVDFDIYFDDHATATAWGHRSFEAFYAGGDGQEIEVTTTERVEGLLCFTGYEKSGDVVKAQMSEEEKSLYEIYVQSKGNRVFFGTPFEYDWHQNIVGNYGYRTSGTSIHDYEYTEVLMPQGTKYYLLWMVQSKIFRTVRLHLRMKKDIRSRLRTAAIYG